MIVFELSMPNKGSWNGKWTQEGQLFVRTRRECDVPKEHWNKSFYYRWMMGGLPVLHQQELQQARQDDWSENLKVFVDMIG